MKKMRHFLFLTIAFTSLQSFQSSDWEVSEILQTAIDLEALERIWEKDDSGDFLPLEILANDHFPEAPVVKFSGREVKLLTTGEAAQMAENTPYLDVTEFRIKKGKKARLQFTYQGVDVKINLRKTEAGWTARSVSMMGNGVRYKYANIDF